MNFGCCAFAKCEILVLLEVLAMFSHMGGNLAKMNLMKMVVTMVYMSEKQRLVFGS